MELSLFDAHCDTALELYRRGERLDRNSCCIDLEKASVFRRYAQCYAVWSDRRLDDEACFRQFFQVADHLEGELSRLSDRAVPVRTGRDLRSAWEEGRHAAILTVEDARLTAGRADRLDALYARGVRCLTFLWGGDTCVGGSHDTAHGLTAFGRELARGCFARGIIPDISHASEQSAEDLLALAAACGKPVIASHSCSHAVYPHSRNLRDRHFDAVARLGGIVGISLCAGHVGDGARRPVTVEDLFAHIEHFLSRGGERAVGIGADLDGADLPEGIGRVGDLTALAEVLARHNYPDELIGRIFWGNLLDFFARNL